MPSPGAGRMGISKWGKDKRHSTNGLTIPVKMSRELITALQAKLSQSENKQSIPELVRSLCREWLQK